MHRGDDNELESLLPKEFVLEQQKRDLERARKLAQQEANKGSWVSCSCCTLVILLVSFISLMMLTDDPAPAVSAMHHQFKEQAKAIREGVMQWWTQEGSAEQPDELTSSPLPSPSPDGPSNLPENENQNDRQELQSEDEQQQQQRQQLKDQKLQQQKEQEQQQQREQQQREQQQREQQQREREQQRLKEEQQREREQQQQQQEQEQQRQREQQQQQAEREQQQQQQGEQGRQQKEHRQARPKSHEIHSTQIRESAAEDLLQQSSAHLAASGEVDVLLGRMDTIKHELDQILHNSKEGTPQDRHQQQQQQQHQQQHHHPNVQHLPSEDDLLLDEIPLQNTANLHDENIESLTPYTMYRTPSEHWVENAQEILEKSSHELQNAHFHVNDPEQRVTVVTALFDLGRGTLDPGGQFKRSFNEYLQRFQRTINVNFPMVIFMDPHHVSMINFDTHTNGVIVIPWSIKHLEEAYPTYFSRIEEIRGSELYKRQAHQTGWLEHSPQAALKYYNLLVMAKPFLLRWAALLNPWRTQYLMFVDAGHDCIGALKTDHLQLLRKLMGRMMVTYFDYNMHLMGETHGMPQQAYRHYLGPPHNNHTTWTTDSCCRVVRGGIFGGTPAYIDVFARVYNEALSQSLSDGYMGTEENVMGMCAARFPSLFNQYQNARDNCDVFVDSGERAAADAAIYVQGDAPDLWSPEKHDFVKQAGHNERMVTYGHRTRG